MTIDGFRASDKVDTLSPALQALWHEARGDWDKAHELAQSASGYDGDWVHAYLHRKEGDDSNARYWYSRAGRPEFRGSLEDEWNSIAVELLRKTSPTTTP